MTEVLGFFVVALLAGGIERANAWAQVRRRHSVGMPSVEAIEPLVEVERNNIRLSTAGAVLLVAAPVLWCLGEAEVGGAMAQLAACILGTAFGLGGAIEQMTPPSDESR